MTRAHPRWLIPPIAAVLLWGAGCANQQSTTQLGGSVVVHTFRREYANAHVIVQGGNALMFDSGLETNGAALAGALRAAGIAPERLRAIVLSHGHADHAGGARYFQQTFGTRIIVGSGDGPLVGKGRNDPLCPTNDEARGRLATDQNATYAPFVPDVAVDAELDLAPLTGIAARIVAVPGHTAGSLVVVLPEARVALVGDLFRGAVVGSSAEVHFYMCDLDDNRRDVRLLLEAIAPTAESFFTGHFGPVSRAAVRERFGP